MDKVNMSVAVIPMAQELGWSGLERGLVSSSFFWGYTLTQLPGGYISTKIGGARVLAAGVALWSVATLVAPPAAQLSLLALCFTRMVVGLGEGVAPSAATSLLAKMMPPNERSRAVSYVWGGLDVGSVVGLLLCGPLIKAWGWPSVFYLFAVLGLVWCAFWPMLKADKVEPVVHQQYSLMGSVEEPTEVKEAFEPNKVYTGLQSSAGFTSVYQSPWMIPSKRVSLNSQSFIGPCAVRRVLQKHAGVGRDRCPLQLQLGLLHAARVAALVL